MSKSQLGAILNGQIRELPAWPVVRGLVESFLSHAASQGRTGALTLPTGVEEFWRPHYAMVDHALEQAAHRASRRRSVGAPGRADAPTGLRQLPAPLRHFAGRTAELAALTSLLDENPGSGRAVVIAMIGGTAGVGKTTLAVQWAHQVADRFRDGHLFVNLRGFDPGRAPMSPAEALRVAFDALAIPPERVPASLDAQSSLYRTILTRKQMLVILDNARNPEQVRPLLPAASGCMVVITSRNSLAGLVATHDLHPVMLDLLPFESAHELLTQRLGSERTAAEPEAVREIITRCAGLPLALAVASARAALQPGRSLGAVAGDLRRAHEDLDVFACDDPVADMQTVFSCSYEALSDGAARLFRLLALTPGPDVAAPAVTSLAGVSSRRARLLLAELVGAHLLTERADGRYAFHDLLRTYAREQARKHEPAADRHAALRRLLDHYLLTAYAADRAIYPLRDPITPITPDQGIRAEPIASREQAFAWFTRERAALVSAVEQAYQSGLYTHSWQIAWALMTFLDRQGHWSQWAATQEQALNAAWALHDAEAQALSHRILGQALIRLGRYDDAHLHLKKSVEMHSELGDDIGTAHAHMNIGEAYLRESRLADALGHADRALALYELAGHQTGRANALNNSGWVYAQLGDYGRGRQRCDMALALHRLHGDVQGQATTWDSLGDIRKDSGDFAGAVACYQQALLLYRKLGARYYEALALINAGDAHYLSEQHEPAHSAWQQAFDILNDLDDASAAKLREKLDSPEQGLISLAK